MGLGDIEIEDAVGSKAHGHGGPEDDRVKGDVERGNEVAPDKFERIEVGLGGYGKALGEGGSAVADYALGGMRKAFGVGFEGDYWDFIRGRNFLFFRGGLLRRIIVNSRNRAVHFDCAPEFGLWEKEE